MDRESPRPTLLTSRLLLRPFEMSDAKEVQRLAGEPEVARTTAAIPHPYVDGLAEHWIQSHAESWQRGEAVQFAITKKIENELVGAISLQISRAHHRAELGYWIGKAFWNQGYASEASIVVVRFGFDQLGLNKITARCLDINPASGKVLAKAGMLQEGHLKQEFFKDGQFHDLLVYGLTKAEHRR